MLIKKEIFLGYFAIIIAILNFLFLIYFLIDLIYVASFSWPYKDGSSNEYIFVVETLFWKRFVHHCHFFRPKFLVFPIYFSGMIIGYGFGTYIRKMTKYNYNDLKNSEKKGNNFNLNAAKFLEQKKIQGTLFFVLFLIMLFSMILLIKITYSFLFYCILFYLPLLSFNYFWDLSLKEDDNKLYKVLFITVIIDLVILITTLLSSGGGCM